MTGSLALALATLFTATTLTMAQAVPPSASAEEKKDSDVVAVVDGRSLTLGEIRAFLAAMPAQNRGTALQNPEAFLRQYALMGKLTELAESNNLAEQSPYKEQLEYQRRMVLSTAGINLLSQRIGVSDAEMRSYYQAHQNDFAEVRVKVIYIPFLNTAPKEGEARTSMTEAEALAHAQKIVADIKGGADFVEMVKQHSKDEGSRAKDGDFATLKMSDNIPQAVKDVVFALEVGAVSDPVRQPNGFYIFRAEEKKLPEFEAVAPSINTKVHDEKFRRRMDELRDSIQLTDIKADLLKP
jgi:peptidyl-prolyl cis-trans isomerase C